MLKSHISIDKIILLKKRFGNVCKTRFLHFLHIRKALWHKGYTRFNTSKKVVLCKWFCVFSKKCNVFNENGFGYAKTYVLRKSFGEKIVFILDESCTNICKNSINDVKYGYIDKNFTIFTTVFVVFVKNRASLLYRVKRHTAAPHIAAKRIAKRRKYALFLHRLRAKRW